jgi:hypothetical protein
MSEPFLLRRLLYHSGGSRHSFAQYLQSPGSHDTPLRGHSGKSLANDQPNPILQLEIVKLLRTSGRRKLLARSEAYFGCLNPRNGRLD